MHTWCVPRLSSANLVPSVVSKIRINVPRSPAVAKRVPWIFSAKQVTADSCAIISSGVRSVLAKSTIYSKIEEKKCQFYRHIHSELNIEKKFKFIENHELFGLPTHDHSYAMDRPKLVCCCSDIARTDQVDSNLFQKHAIVAVSMWM